MDLGLATLGLQAIITGSVSTEDFSAVTGAPVSESKRTLDFFTMHGIGHVAGEQYIFDTSDRLSAALMLVKKGALIDDVSVHLDWRSFEGLAARVLESKGFAVIKNMVLTKPRMEIDIVGIYHGVALLIDCKHWRRQSASSLNNTVQKQVLRTKQYVTKTQGAIAVPAIVTLYNEVIDFIDRVPIVPIQQLSSFVDEFYGNLDEVKTIQKD